MHHQNKNSSFSAFLLIKVSNNGWREVEPQASSSCPGIQTLYLQPMRKVSWEERSKVKQNGVKGGRGMDDGR